MPIDKESPPSLSLKMMVLNAKRSHSDVDGQVKEMVSLVNLKKRFVMRFDVVKISYLGELGYDYGPIPFRFYRYWLEVDGFDKLVRDSWNVAPVNKKNAIRNFMGKLKFLKDRIRSWLSIHRSNSRGEIYFLKEELRSCDEVIDKGDCSNEVIHKRTEILNKIHQVNNIQASEIAQKAKIKWAIEGDENVKFFHGMLNKKRNQSNIRGIMVNGTWVDDPVQVKREFFEHFRGRFDKPSVNRACIDTPFPVSLSIDQKEDMERRISKEEVKRAVWDCGVDKSPGPDGFSFSFYRHFWPVIEKDVFEAVDYFFMYGEIPNGCNSNFIALIPKILDANMVKDFRPISLIGSLYKIIAKILANRLVGVLGDLVNEVQSAFVADRQILDGPFILDEVLQWCRRKKKHALIFKVDFEKAFDSVRWDFVDDVLNKFGFGERWRTWIQSCLRSSRGSILVNGSPTEEFQFFRGLKQGDPLSPFLFILIMESLHISFQRVVDAGLFTGIKINSMVNLSHLFYADDAIFLGQWSELNIDSLVRVLDCFFRASGLRINMCKSKIMGVNVEDGMVKNAASKLGVSLSLRLHQSLYFGYECWGKLCHGKQAWKKWWTRLHPIEVGGLGDTRFWVDNWYEGGVIKELFPRMFALELNKNATVSLKLNVSSLDNSFRRKARSGIEEMQLNSLAEISRMTTLVPCEDRYVWTLESDGVFSVASIRKEIDGNRFQDVSLPTRWVKSVPIKMNIIAWKVKSNALPTRFNISRRGMDIDSIVCPICNAGVESTNHFFSNAL
ncbi:RNA-directed DNA polymerase, eukaryota [Tanacetum coccineum]|uniref:RNA-directed DNA polymerase, eukaryota n=1 Tax=Tanacetum coccineum TaxID=301880 RepID=A0ABQ5IEC5_9ASTR